MAAAVKTCYASNMMSRMIGYFTSHKNDLTLLFTVVYTLTFTVNAFVDHNFEFLYYTFLMVALLCFVLLLNQQLHLGFFILFSLSLLGFLHLLGGNLILANGARLYDTYFLNGVLKYDNIVHTFGTFTATLMLYNLIADFIDDRIRQHYAIFSLLLVLMAIGIGTINELVEFLAVVFLGASEQVGDYFNNSLDLFFNTVGSIIACVLIYVYRERPRFYRRLEARLARRDS
jgi:uncharacterized membrane protein YjdF